MQYPIARPEIARPPVQGGFALQTSPAAVRGSKWLVGFVVFLLCSQLALVFLDQLALFIGETGPLRMIIRVATYGASLALLFVIPRGGRRHPAALPAVWVLVITAVSILHPTTNTWLSGTAQAVLYLAILAPLFWVPRLAVGLETFKKVVIIFWGFHALSAALGVLQVYFPGVFQPSLSSVIQSYGEDYVESLYIVTAAGHRVFRPMGLTDTPGGAAMSGFFAILFGSGLLLAERRHWVKALCLISMTLGLTSIYLSQIRSVLVLAILSIIVFAAVLGLRGQLARVSLFSTMIAAVLVGSFGLAVAIGGESVTSRLSTLTEDRASSVYYSNRGRFLEETVEELLPRYPFGAGLGRWGMMNSYFGSNADPERAAIWVEIQWTGWLLDGGVPLILAYSTALLMALVGAWNIARYRASGRSDNFPVWGALLFGYNVGVIAVTFNYPYFIGESGMQFWLLNAALFAAAQTGRSPTLRSSVA